MNDIPYVTSLRSALVQGISRHHRRVRRRRLLFASMSGLVVLVMGMGVATGAIQWRIWPIAEDIPPGAEPVPIGPERTIARGSLEEDGESLPWRLTAFRSDKGLCLHLETPRWKGGGCGFGVPEEGAISYAADDRFLYGPVDVQATRIEVRFNDGGIRSLEPIRGSEDFSVNFYLIELGPADEVVSVAAFDNRGAELGAVTLRR